MLGIIGKFQKLDEMPQMLDNLSKNLINRRNLNKQIDKKLNMLVSFFLPLCARL